MIDRAAVLDAFQGHVASVVQSVDTAGPDNAVWATYAALDVDQDAVLQAGLAWARLSGTPAHQLDATVDGFANGFLVACRVLGARAGA